jgi:hypothetical protein
MRRLTAAAPWLALAACLAFPLSYPALSVDDTPSYLGPAREWAAGRGLREANGEPLQQRLPLYPLLLGCTLRIAGDSKVALGLLNAILHVLSVLLVRAALPRRPRSDLLCAAALVYPPLLTTTGLVLQESLIACTLSVLFVTTTRALRPGASAAWGLLAGVALGTSGLAKTTVLPAGALLLLLLSTTRGARRRALAFVAGTALLLSPWALRNRLELGRFELANANAGVNLFAGTVGNVVSPTWDSFPEYLEARTRWEAGDREREPVFDRYLARLAIERIAADPLRWAGLALERAFRYMLPARHWFFATGRSRPASIGPAYVAATAIQLGLFCACGLLLLEGLRRRDPAALVAPLIVLSHHLVYAASHASPRYGASVGPLLFATAALLSLPAAHDTPPAEAPQARG